MFVLTQCRRMPALPARNRFGITFRISCSIAFLLFYITSRKPNYSGTGPPSIFLGLLLVQLFQFLFHHHPLLLLG
jgi:hypothetical protein